MRQMQRILRRGRLEDQNQDQDQEESHQCRWPYQRQEAYPHVSPFMKYQRDETSSRKNEKDVVRTPSLMLLVLVVTITISSLSSSSSSTTTTVVTSSSFYAVDAFHAANYHPLRYGTVCSPISSGSIMVTITTQGMKSSVAVSRSRSRSRLYESKPRPRKKKNQGKNSGSEIDGVDVNSLLTNMGLQPVVREEPKSQDQKSTIPSHSASHLTGSDSGGLVIDIETQLEYARNGHTVLRRFFDPTHYKLAELRTTLLDYAHQEELLAWQQKVEVALASSSSSSCSSEATASNCKTVEECQIRLQELLGPSAAASLPFLQYFNVWRSLEEVESLIRYDHRLAQAAAVLMDVESVRLYQDAIFWKRQNDGPTPWHVDARMAPFDTTNIITFWIPLQPIPQKGSGLIFCSKSHSDFALPYWNPPDRRRDDDKDVDPWDHLDERYPKQLVDYMPFRIGDISAHSGWTLHCSNGGGDDGDGQDRVALAVSFVDGDATIRADWKEKGDNEDSWSYKDWCQDVKPRRKFKHNLVPIVFPPGMSD